MKKYELTSKSINRFSRTLYQIRALIDFGDIASGTLGGFIEKEENLSQKGWAWVRGNALVYGDAYISDNAQALDNAHISDKAILSGNARVSGSALVFGRAEVSGNAFVLNNTRIHDAKVYGCAEIRDNARISGNVHILDNAQVFGKADISGNVKIFDDVKVSGNSQISETVSLYGKAEMRNALIRRSNHFVYLESPVLLNGCITFFYTKESKIYVVYGFFFGTIDEFETIAMLRGKRKEREACFEAITLVKSQIEMAY